MPLHLRRRFNPNVFCRVIGFSLSLELGSEQALPLSEHFLIFRRLSQAKIVPERHVFGAWILSIGSKHQRLLPPRAAASESDQPTLLRLTALFISLSFFSETGSFDDNFSCLDGSLSDLLLFIISANELAAGAWERISTD